MLSKKIFGHNFNNPYSLKKNPTRVKLHLKLPLQVFLPNPYVQINIQNLPILNISVTPYIFCFVNF